MTKPISEFQKTLLTWYQKNKRDLPWRQTRDPYAIWISEIVLQQTRIVQGIPYYLRFLELFPDLKTLAQAPLEEVLKAWQGLGYYSRARNMHATAQIIHSSGEQFPKTFEQLIQLPGIGSYTAAAIASIAFNEPKAVCDGNVIRFLSRYFGIFRPVDLSSVQADIRKLASDLLVIEQAGTFNQALMEFGALQCTPANPGCNHCPFMKSCLAYIKGRVPEIPLKGKEKKSRSRYFHYLIIGKNDGFFLEKRSQKDIWRDLYQFPLIEQEKKAGTRALKNTDPYKILLLPEKTSLNKKGTVKHLLSHQILEITFWHIVVPEAWQPPSQLIFVGRENYQQYPVPVPIARFMKKWYHP